MAAGYGRGRCATLLLSHGADPFARDHSGRTPRDLAIDILRLNAHQGGPGKPAVHRGKIQQVADVLKAAETEHEAAGPTAGALHRMERVLTEARDVRHDQLVAAASSGDLMQLRPALNAYLQRSQGKRGRRTDPGVQTALTAACRRNHAAGADLLSKHSPNLDSFDSQGATPLLAAADNGAAECVELLLKRGASVDAKDRVGVSALIAAAYNGHADCVRVLLASGAIVNSGSHGGVTPLIAAAEGGSAECVRLLTQAGASLSSRTTEGKTALMYAVGRDAVGAVEALLAAKVAVDPADNEGRTALHHAAKKGAAACLRLLLAAGADATRRCGHGHTAVSDAAEGTEAARVLAQHWEELEAEAMSRQEQLLDELQGTGNYPLSPSTSSPLPKPSGHDKRKKKCKKRAHAPKVEVIPEESGEGEGESDGAPTPGDQCGKPQGSSGDMEAGDEGIVEGDQEGISTPGRGLEVEGELEGAEVEGELGGLEVEGELGGEEVDGELEDEEVEAGEGTVASDEEMAAGRPVEGQVQRGEEQKREAAVNMGAGGMGTENIIENLNLRDSLSMSGVSVDMSSQPGQAGGDFDVQACSFDEGVCSCGGRVASFDGEVLDSDGTLVGYLGGRCEVVRSKVPNRGAVEERGVGWEESEENVHLSEIIREGAPALPVGGEGERRWGSAQADEGKPAREGMGEASGGAEVQAMREADGGGGRGGGEVDGGGRGGGGGGEINGGGVGGPASKVEGVGTMTVRAEGGGRGVRAGEHGREVGEDGGGVGEGGGEVRGGSKGVGRGGREGITGEEEPAGEEEADEIVKRDGGEAEASSDGDAESESPVGRFQSIGPAQDTMRGGGTSSSSSWQEDVSSTGTSSDAEDWITVGSSRGRRLGWASPQPPQSPVGAVPRPGDVSHKISPPKASSSQHSRWGSKAGTESTCRPIRGVGSGEAKGQARDRGTGAKGRDAVVMQERLARTRTRNSNSGVASSWVRAIVEGAGKGSDDWGDGGGSSRGRQKREAEASVLKEQWRLQAWAEELKALAAALSEREARVGEREAAVTRAAALASPRAEEMPLQREGALGMEAGDTDDGMGLELSQRQLLMAMKLALEEKERVNGGVRAELEGREREAARLWTELRVLAERVTAAEATAAAAKERMIQVEAAAEGRVMAAEAVAEERAATAEAVAAAAKETVVAARKEAQALKVAAVRREEEVATLLTQFRHESSAAAMAAVAASWRSWAEQQRQRLQQWQQSPPAARPFTDPRWAVGSERAALLRSRSPPVLAQGQVACAAALPPLPVRAGSQGHGTSSGPDLVGEPDAAGWRAKALRRQSGEILAAAAVAAAMVKQHQPEHVEGEQGHGRCHQTAIGTRGQQRQLPCHEQQQQRRRQLLLKELKTEGERVQEIWSPSLACSTAATRQTAAGPLLPCSHAEPHTKVPNRPDLLAAVEAFRLPVASMPPAISSSRTAVAANTLWTGGAPNSVHTSGVLMPLLSAPVADALRISIPAPSTRLRLHMPPGFEKQAGLPYRTEPSAVRGGLGEGTHGDSHGLGGSRSTPSSPCAELVHSSPFAIPCARRPASPSEPVFGVRQLSPMQHPLGAGRQQAPRGLSRMTRSASEGCLSELGGQGSDRRGPRMGLLPFSPSSSPYPRNNSGGWFSLVPSPGPAEASA